MICGEIAVPPADWSVRLTVLLGDNDSIARPDLQALRHQLNEVQDAENRSTDKVKLEDDGDDGASIS